MHNNWVNKETLSTINYKDIFHPQVYYLNMNQGLKTSPNKLGKEEIAFAFAP